MKQSHDNEMDILLRGLAKRAPSVSNSGNGRAEHLDADELNAFAERTLPLAARARYTAHLVDCSRCRKLVAELSAAAGVPVVETKTERQHATGFWQRMSAVFSPVVLRFAVPALAMLAVIAVGVITFRQERNADFVARQQEPVATRAIGDAETEPAAKSQSAFKDVPATSDASPAAPEQSPAAPARETRTEEKPVGTADKVSTIDTTTSELVAKDAPKPSKAGEESQPTFAPEPPPAPAAQAQIAAKSETTKNEAQPKEKAQGEGVDVAAPAMRDERSAEDRPGYLSRSRKAAIAGRGGAAVQSTESRRNEAEQSKRADYDEYTVSVGGRRFRKQGNSWIDTAYDTSRPAMTVVRGSEQYRVLIADEPSIRTIAERLAGEVIVVWKGRAYRIR